MISNHLILTTYQMRENHTIIHVKCNVRIIHRMGVFSFLTGDKLDGGNVPRCCGLEEVWVFGGVCGP
jgi:hypothetical protein